MYYAYKHWGKNTLYSALHITLDNIRARTTVTRGKVLVLAMRGYWLKPRQRICVVPLARHFILCLVASWPNV